MFRQHVQLAIEEGRLKFTKGSKMKLDHGPLHMYTIDFNDKKVLIPPEQAVSTNGKEIVIREPRPKMIMPKCMEVGVWKENKGEASSSRTSRKLKASFEMLLYKYENRNVEQRPNKCKDQDHLLGRDLVNHQSNWSHRFLTILKSCHGGLVQCCCQVELFLTSCHGAPPPIYEFMPPMPPMEFHQGWVEP